MSPMSISWVVFACTFIGAPLGTFLRRVLPEHHIDENAKDLVKLGMADRNDGCSCLGSVDRVGEELSRSAEHRSY
jgi:hypothetical protein